MSSTQYNHRYRCEQIIDDIFSSARIYHFSHKGILDNLHERLYNHNSWKRLAQVRQQYLLGYIDALFKQLWQEMEWRVYHPQHGHIRRENITILDGKWSEVIPGGGMHFWKNTDYPYTYPDDDTIKWEK